MLVWLNGPFGVGKTATALALQRRWPGSHLFDPEEVGFLLRRVLPPGLQTPDFQDMPLWREQVLHLLACTARAHPGPVLVPMTLVQPAYFAEIVPVLRQTQTVHHFTLLAPPEILYQRLAVRGDGRDSWPAQQIHRCLSALAHPCFGVHLETQTRSIEALADEIRAHCARMAKP
ncbi:MAG: AAA family ATPase [Candidatus Sericytochromatia bacterium]